MLDVFKQVRLILFCTLGLGLIFLPQVSFANAGPTAMNVNGTVFTAGGTPASGFVNFRLQLKDKNDTCVLYQEEHALVNLTTTKGNFSLNLGSGTSRQNFVQGGTTFSSYLFRNDVDLSPGFTGCAPAAVSLTNGDHRILKIDFDTGSGYVAMTPALQLMNDPYSSVAETLQGRTPADFVRINSGVNVTQANVENVFTGANYTKLMDLINGSSSQYVLPNGSNFSPTGTIDFNNQRITDVATPTTASDAVNKGYADSRIGGQPAAAAIATIGAGDAGKVLQWDGSQWVAAAAAGDATKLPLAGGTMAGTITMADNDILNTGFITMNANKYLQLSNNAASPGGLGAGHKGVMWYDSANDRIKFWDGATERSLSTLSGGITSFNGRTDATQTLGVGTTGTAPAWDSSTSTHTLNIPSASGAGVTAGLISKAEYDSFVAKVSNAGGTPSLLSDVIASRPAAGTAGRVFISTDERKIYRDTGATWEVIATTSSADLSGTFSPTGSSLTDSQIWVGNGSNQAAAVPVTGDVALSNTGAITIQNNAVTTGKINDNAITNAKMADDSVNTNELVNGAVTTAKIADANITPSKLAGSSGAGRLPIVNGTNSAFDWLSCAADQSITWDAALGFICETNYTFGTGNLLVARQGAGAGLGAQIRLQSNSGTNSLMLKAPDGMAADRTLVFPAGAGSAGNVLSTDGAGNLSWSAAASGTVSTVGNFAGASDAKGLSISGSDIILHPADGTNPGAVSTGTQTFAGNKTFSGNTSVGGTLGVTGATTLGNTLTVSGAATFNGAGTGVSITNNASVGGNLAVDTNTLVVDSTNNRVGIGTATPVASSILEMVSTTAGLLIPRMTTAQRDAIATPATGLQVYNTTTNALNFYNGATWQALGVAGSGITTFNGRTDSSQSLAIGTSGTAPAWDSSTSTHTLNLPMASGAGVTAGLLSKTDYDAFVAKITNGGGTPSISSDVIASRPAAGTAGRVFIATDERKIYRDTGATWEELSIDTGVTGIGAFSGTSTANGLSISGNNISLHAADATNPGAVTTGAQTLAGAKTFSGAATFSAAGTGVSITNNASVGGNLTVDTNTLFVDSTNNRVGIGTTTTTQPLTIENSENALRGLEIKNTNSASGAAPTLVLTNDSNSSGFVFVGSSGHASQYVNRVTLESFGGAAAGVNIMAGTAGGDIRFYSGGDSISNERMRISSSGNIGVGTQSPHSSALIDISSTTTGLLIPRMTTAERNAIASPATGLQVYNTSTNELNYYNGATWQALGVAGAGITSLGGLTAGTQTFAIGTSGTAPAWNSATSTHTLNIPMASGAGVTAGLLNKTDYDSFVAKISNAGGTPSILSDVIASRPAFGTSGRLFVSTDERKIYRDTGATWEEISPSAAFTVVGSTLTNGRIWVGDGSSQAQEVQVSGDATLANNGALTISNDAITNAKMADNSVNTNELVNSAVTTAKINDGAVTTAKIADANVTPAKLAASSGAGRLPIVNGTNTAFDWLSCAADQTVNWDAALGFICETSYTFGTGNMLVARQGAGAGQGAQIRLQSNSGTNSVILRAPDGLASDLLFRLPATAGSNGNVLTTDGSGVLSWSAASAGGVTTVDTFDATSTANGLSISGSNIKLHAADGTNPGAVTTGAQTLAGAKTFSGAATFSAAGTGVSIANNATVGGNLTVDTSTLFVDSTNNRVGVGTTTPSTNLTVVGSPSGYVQAGTATDYVSMGFDGGNARLSSTGTGNFLINYNNAKNVVIGSSGTPTNFLVNEGHLQVRTSGGVSIGSVTLPTAQQLVLGNTGNRTIVMERHQTADTAGFNLTVQAGGATSAATDKSGGNLILSGGTATGTGSSSIEFRTSTPQGSTNTTDNAPTTKLIVTGAGRVGIGTSSPNASALLDISTTTAGLLIPRMTAAQRDAISSPATGLQVYNTTDNKLNFYNGISWQELGVAGAGITSLGGLSASSQSFAIGTSGTAPTWNSATSTHTLNIPMASAAGVTAGLLSKTDYDSFNSKLGTALTSGQIWVGNGSNVATAVSMSGDATLANTGALTIANNAITTAKINNGAVTASKMFTPVANQASLVSASGVTGDTLAPFNCTNGQTLQWSTGTGWNCVGLTSGTVTSVALSLPSMFSVTGSPITSSGTLSASLANQAQNSVFAGPTSGTGAPTFRALTAADLPAAPYDTTYFKQAGNSFGAAATIGTNDAQNLNIETSNVTRATFQSGGNVVFDTTTLVVDATNDRVGVGTATPSESLDVNGNIRTPNARIYSLSRTLPVVVDDTVDLGTFTATGANSIYLEILVSTTGASHSSPRKYSVPVSFNSTAGAWERVIADYDPNYGSGQDTQLEINVSNAVVMLRLRRSAGTNAASSFITIIAATSAATTFTASTTVTNAAAPVSTVYRPALSRTGDLFRFGEDSIGATGLVTIAKDGDDQWNEYAAHALALVSPVNQGSLMMGYDSTDDLSYINSAKPGTTRALGLNTRGGRVGVGTNAPLDTLHVKTSAGANAIQIDRIAGQTGFLRLATNGVSRWRVGVDGTAEGGSNAGSDFYIGRNNDAGAVIDSPFFIQRSNGSVGIGTTSPATRLSNIATAATDQSTTGVASGGFSWATNQGIAAYVASIENLWSSGGANRNGLLVKITDTGADDFILNANSGGTDRFVVKGNGNTGIGTNNPGAPLHVATAGSFPVYLSQNGFAGTRWNVGPWNTNNNFYIIDEGSQGMYLTKGNGAAGWTANSDARLKENIKPLNSEKSLQDILKINTVTYTWRDQRASQQPQHGLIAQDVQKVFPHLVSVGKDNDLKLKNGKEETVEKTLGVNYTGLIMPLIDSVKALYKKWIAQEKKIELQSLEISSLDTKVSDMASENEKLRKQVEELKKQNLLKDYQIQQMNDRLDKIEKMIQQK